MQSNTQKTANKWQAEMNRVDMDRKILLITAYLLEIQEFPETTPPEIAPKELLLQNTILY